MLVRLTEMPYGGICADPVNQKIRAKIIKHLRDWKAYPEDSDRDSVAFFQGDYELPECITAKHRRELSRGWDVVMRVDAWEFGHWCGWDTCEIL